MGEDSKAPVLVKALDRLKSCAEGQQKKVCLTSGESEKICAYIWWLTDRLAETKEDHGEVDTSEPRRVDIEEQADAVWNRHVLVSQGRY